MQSAIKANVKTNRIAFLAKVVLLSVPLREVLVSRVLNYAANISFRAHALPAPMELPIDDVQHLNDTKVGGHSGRRSPWPSRTSL